MFEDLRRHVGKYYGKYSGQVVANDQDQDNMGSVVVTLPTIFGPTAQITARACLPYGHFFIPAVGTMVWVEFEGGDKDYAIWTGTWYPKGATPEPSAISPPDNRVIQTASGHTIEIMDKAGSESITIKHKDKSFVSIDKDGSIILGNLNGSMVVLDAKNEQALMVEQHGNSMTMDANGIVVTQRRGRAMLQMTDDTIRLAAPNIILQGLTVCGDPDPTVQPPPAPVLLLDPSTQSMLAAFLMTHTHATAMGPSGPPLPPGPVLVPGTNVSGAVLSQ